MSRRIPLRLLQEVKQRAGDYCEYCLLPQSSQEATFHVDHVVPRIANGKTELDNLALACVSCSLRKAARQEHVDPRSKKLVRLFHPRSDDWDDHFAFTRTWRIRGRTPSGRATSEALAMNRSAIILIRQELVALGRFPPD